MTHVKYNYHPIIILPLLHSTVVIIMIGCVDSKYDLLDHKVTVYIPGNKTFWLFDCNRIEEQGDKSKGKSKLIPLI